MKNSWYLLLCLAAGLWSTAHAESSKNRMPDGTDLIEGGAIIPNTRKIDYYQEVNKLTNFPKESNTGSGYEVAALLGSPNVANSGAASYALSLDLPPAAGNFAPKLALAYGSYNGNGALGMGFKLEGISMIVRDGKNKLLDGKVGPISYIDAVDNFRWAALDP